METLILKIDTPENIAAIERAAEILRNGGLVAIPTETVYGLAANALNPDAVENIFKAKGRPQDNPLIVHISSLEELPPLVKKIDSRLPRLAEEFWPGPLTVIMPKSDAVPPVVSAGLDTVAIRMPSHPVARAIIRASGVPLAAPSANASGRPSPTNAMHVLLDLDGKIDAVADSGKCSIGVESTVISLAGKVPVLLRPGGITPEQLERVLGKIEIAPAVFSALPENEKAQSPGMKYKHYSPKAAVTIVEGSFEKFVRFVALLDGSAAICFNGEGKYFKNAVEYGKSDDSLSQANGLFAALREVDRRGFKKAFVRCPKKTGVGLAVYNRLLRAAAFRELNLTTKTPVIGITGQTGSGKTTLCTALREAGCEIIDGDIVARDAVKNPAVLKALCDYFGNDIIADGSLDRRKLAGRAFSSEEGTKALNDITHPEITRIILDKIDSARAQGAKAAVIDAAALFESPLVPYCDIIVSVLAKLDTRIERIISRDSITREAALVRANAQGSEEYYASKSDIIIRNDGEPLNEQLMPLIEIIELMGEA